MRRLLAAFMALGLLGAACSGGGPAEPADIGAEPGNGQAESELGAAAVGGSAEPADIGAEPGEVQLDADEPESERTIGAEEMMPDELNVAHFLEWPTANQVARTNKAYDDALGMIVNWIPFASGADMARAMEAGDIDISYSQGVTSFAHSVTSGSDLLLVAVAASYADSDNCVAHPDLGVASEHAAETLTAQSVDTPPGNGTHVAIGVHCFDVIATSGEFAEAYPGVVTAFLQVTEDANRAFNDDRDPFIDTIAGAAGMDRETAVALLDAFGFPEKDAQLSEAWLGGTVQQFMKDQMDLMVDQGEITAALPSYASFVDASFLEAVN